MSQSNNPFADQPDQYLNPYASPSMPAGYSATQYMEGGVFRQGNVLVMHKMAKLPPFCVKTNEPAEEWLKRKLTWHSPWLALLILVNIIVFAIVALIVQKKAEIMIGLSKNRLRIHRQRQMILAALIILGIVSIIGGIVGAANQTPGGPEWMIAFLPLGFLLLIVSFFYGVFACRLIVPKKINDTHVWLKGIHPGYLDRLPVWPGP